MDKRGVNYAIDYLKGVYPTGMIPDNIYHQAGITGLVSSLAHSLRRAAKGGKGKVLVTYHPDNSGHNVAFYRWNPDYKAPETPAKAPIVEADGCKACSPKPGGVIKVNPYGECLSCGKQIMKVLTLPTEADGEKGLVKALELLVKQCRGVNYEYRIPASISVDEIEEILTKYRGGKQYG